MPRGQQRYIAQKVYAGMSNKSFIEIKQGLDEGDMYVARGAFKLKAKIVTSSLGEHAGHGH